jgi:membrane glycosyltransferase
LNEHTPIHIDVISLGNPGALPEEKPAAFPKQDFWEFDTSKRLNRTRDAAAIWRRTLIFGCPAVFAAFTATTLSDALQTGEIPALKTIMVSLLAVNIYWLAVLCTIAIAGFLVLLSRSRLSLIRLDHAASPYLRGKTAVLMPVFAEAPERVFATALATLSSLAREKCGENFDVFVLSDTTDPAIWACEETLLAVARAHIGGRQQLYYRRRAANTEKKAGNLADWCRRWGGAYDYMVVFDADSLMSGKTLVRLATALEQNADVALIQTSSVLINRRTLFGRYQQFINRVYDYWCPAMTAGMAFWHRGSGSYWGHNAIIRVRAFCESAGLPRLSGEPPFGGHVLSHDFVEAALLRRVGWRLCLMPEIEESYEETPPTTIDWAIRERRWCQGNLQHGRILAARGLSWVSRVHLAFGIMYMVSSILWVCFCATAFASHRHPARAPRNARSGIRAVSRLACARPRASCGGRAAVARSGGDAQAARLWLGRLQP